MKRVKLLWMGIVCVFMLFLGSSVAQQTTGTILGTVTDSTGAVIPGATITLRNVDTGITRTVTSDEAGRFRASSLSVGAYEVTTEAPGFQTMVRTGVTLTVGQEALINFGMQVGAVAEKITVTGEAPLVEVTSSSVSSVVQSETIRALPLNGRSFDELALLQPGVLLAAAPSSTPSWWGNARRLSIGGGRPTQAVTLLDGTNINTIVNSSGSAVSGNLLGVDAVREFRVLGNNVSAEYGRSQGGVINVVTQSGTNEFHGFAFEFLRNSAMDAKDWFEPHDKPITPYKRNQFGAGLGGPIVKDRLFFYGTYEGLRERLGRIRSTQVMDANAHQGIIAGTPVTIAPQVKPYLDLFPLPNGRSLGGGIGEINLSATQPTNQNFGQMRIDYQLSANHSFFARYSDDRADISDVFSGGVLTKSQGVLEGAFQLPGDLQSLPRNTQAFNHYSTIQLTSILSPTMLNSVRLSYTRIGFHSQAMRNPKILTFDNGYPTLGTVTVAGGGGAIGLGAVTGDGDAVQNYFQYNEDLTVSRGAHALKFGFEAERFQDFWRFDFRTRWAWRFNTITDFLLGNATGGLDGAIRGSDPTHYPRQSLFGFYAQDDWRVNSRLTLNLGLRYEPATLGTNANKRQPKFGAVADIKTSTKWDLVDHPFKTNPSLKNFQPRVGFAWDITGDGKMALRGGLSMLYEPLLPNYWLLMTATPPLTNFVTVSANAKGFPNGLGNFAATPPLGNTEGIDYNTTDSPRVVQYNLSLQRELPGNMGATIGYVGSFARHLGGQRDYNSPVATIKDGRIYQPSAAELGLPSTVTVAPRRNPNFDNLGQHFTGNDAYYNSLQLSLDKRFSRGLTAGANYTFMRSIDTLSAIRSGESAGLSKLTIPECMECDRGIGDFNRKHSFRSNFSYNLPIGPKRAMGGDLTGVAGKALEGWSVSGIVSLNSALPRTYTISLDRARSRSAISAVVYKPDLAPGGNNNPVEGTTAGCAGITNKAGQKRGTLPCGLIPASLCCNPQGSMAMSGAIRSPFRI